MAKKSGMKYGFWKTKAGAEKGRKQIRETKGGWSGASVRKVIGPHGKGWGVARRGTWEPGWFFFKVVGNAKPDSKRLKDSKNIGERSECLPSRKSRAAGKSLATSPGRPSRGSIRRRLLRSARQVLLSGARSARGIRGGGTDG